MVTCSGRLRAKCARFPSGSSTTDTGESSIPRGKACSNHSAKSPGEQTRRSPWQTLTGTLRNEAALLVAVVAVTGLLTNTSPSHAEHNHPGSPSPTAIPLDVTSQGLEVTGTLSPGTVGVNHLTFALAYLLEGDEARLTSSTGIDAGT